MKSLRSTFFSLFFLALARGFPCDATEVHASGGPSVFSDVVSDTNTASETVLRERIQRAIRRLGSADFDEREMARREVDAFGALAWDALRIAARDSDLEVSLQAKYLLQHLLVTGPVSEDPHESHALLERYAAQSEHERLRRVAEMAKIPGPAVLHSLARIVRLEESEWVSRRAAIAVVRRPMAPLTADRDRLARTLDDVARRGDRVGLQWLRAYSQTLRAPERIRHAWSGLLDIPGGPSGSLDPTAGDGDSARVRSANREMLQWYAESLLRLGLRRDAERIMLAYVEQLPRDGNVSLESVDWLIQCRGWTALQQLERRFALVPSDADYGYRLVDAARRRGDFAAAEQVTEVILDRPVSSISDRLQVGSFLVDRNMAEIAAREYDRALKDSDLESSHRVYLLAAKASMYRSQGDTEECARHYQESLDFPVSGELPPDEARTLRQARLHLRLQFAEMLHDQGQDLAAADVLTPLAEPSEEDAPEVEQLTDVLELFPKARREYFWSEDARRQNDLAKQLQHLTAGLKAAPEDVDILIALYRVPNYAEHAAIRQTVRRVAQQMRSEISDRMKMLSRELPNTPDVREITDDLAKSLNVYAWLVANTEGDFEDAIACSQRSLEIQPKQAGYMDTLARCYFATKNWDQALYHQETAVDLDPYSGQMNTQLALFRQYVPVLQRGTGPSP